jgi:hypothetical protein
MHRLYSIWQLFLARLRSFYRVPEAIFWVYCFPILLAVGLGLAFSNRKPEAPRVDIQELPQTTEGQALAAHLNDRGVKAEIHDETTCRERLRDAKSALFIVPLPERYRYVFDDTRPESVSAHYQVDDLIQRWKAGTAVWPAEVVNVEEVGNRYIDFLLPGLMGLNLMGGGLWGVGFVLVDMRVRKLLKRLLATPMRRGDFLATILTARMVFLLPEMILLLLVGTLGFGMPLRGNLLTVLLVIVVGATTFSGIGLLVACRTDKTETVSGLMNLVMLPMWVLSGTFFSSERFPDTVQPIVQALPLTQLNHALRETILQGASLGAISVHLGILVVWGAVTFALALWWFRWQ